MNPDDERAEWRAAAAAAGHAGCPAGGHRYIRQRPGGGVCTRCGDTLEAGEL